MGESYSSIRAHADFIRDVAKYQQVANFESSYHAILEHPALAKFMVVPHYVYLLLKMAGRTGILTFRGDLQKFSAGYFRPSPTLLLIAYASTNRLPDTSGEVLIAVQ